MKVTPLQQIFDQARIHYLHWIEPDSFLRYEPVLRLLRTGHFANALEIGSGEHGVRTYTDFPVVQMDPAIKKNHAKSLKLAGTACALPFEDNSFDLVFAVDLLEHLQAPERASALHEILRVAQKTVCMVFPCGPQAEAQDRKITSDVSASIVVDILNEHASCSFPTRNEAIQWCRFDKNIRTSTVSRSYNLHLREWLTKGWLRRRAWTNALMWCLARFPFLFRLFHFGNCYRLILTLQKKSGA